MLRSTLNKLLSTNLFTVLNPFTNEKELKQFQPDSNLFFNASDLSLISPRGFLPGKNPLQQLPKQSELNVRLNSIATNLSELLKNQQLVAEVDKLNLEFPHGKISIDKFDKHQQNVAILFLVMIAQAYIWENNDNPQSKIPNVIATNLYDLCRSQQRYPTITYSDYVLHNWRVLDKRSDISLDNIEPLLTFTGSKDEAWFIKIHVAIEYACSKAICAASHAYNLLKGINKDQYLNQNINPEVEQELIKLLNIIETSVKEAILILQKMKDHCDPENFFFKLRPYLGGWEKVKNKNTDKENTGVQFEGVETKDSIPTQSYRGPSGAQSSIVPALDAFLGIEHDINGMFRTLLEFQEYMPKKHSAFIKLLSKSKLSKLTEISLSAELKAARVNAIHQLELFRARHIGIVHQYIFNPVGKLGLSKNDIKGTGGAPINEYLGGRYTSTRMSSSHS